MVTDLITGQLYELDRPVRFSEKDTVDLKYDVCLWTMSIYLYLDYCQSSEMYSVLDVKNSRVLYIDNIDDLKLRSREISYERSTKKIGWL